MRPSWWSSACGCERSSCDSAAFLLKFWAELCFEGWISSYCLLLWMFVTLKSWFWDLGEKIRCAEFEYCFLDEAVP